MTNESRQDNNTNSSPSSPASNHGNEEPVENLNDEQNSNCSINNKEVSINKKSLSINSNNGNEDEQDNNKSCDESSSVNSQPTSPQSTTKINNLKRSMKNNKCKITNKYKEFEKHKTQKKELRKLSCFFIRESF